MNAAVRTLHNDLVKMRRAEATVKKAETALKTAGTTEKTALAKIATQRQAILDQFLSPAQPVTNPTALLNQEFNLGRQQAQTESSFKATVAKDKQAIASGKTAVSADRKPALKDLLAGELHMNLKDTNRVRNELGLRSVKKPIREPAGLAGSWKPGPGTLRGADSSHYVSNAQFQQSLRGSQYSLIGATQGHSYVDPTFSSRWKELGQKVKSGKMAMRLAYHFMEAGDGVGQAKHFLKTVGVHGKLPAGTRLGLDWEAGALSDPRALRDAASYIHKVTGTWPLVYTQGSELSAAKAAVPKSPMWEAAWGATDNRQVPFFQYSAGEHNGLGYDQDVFNGNLRSLKRFAGYAT
jgi:GH25 family lysozyme M1 (1,4-beta-N-acetylmuramidase)